MAKGKPAVWLAIEERVFSVDEVILLTWVASKNCSYRENKNRQLALGKNTLEINEFAENECLPNLELKFKFLENSRKPLTRKSTRKHINIDFERVSFICALAQLTKI